MSDSELKPSVALIIPVYNEEEVLPQLIRELEVFRATRSETIRIYLVNDGSTDSTFVLARELTTSFQGYVLIDFSRNFGHQLAVSAGLEICEEDAAIIMDADLQDPLAVAGEMIDKWQEGSDIVHGVRRSRQGVSFMERITARLYYRVFRALTGVEAPMDAGDFRLLARPVINAFGKFKEQQPYVRGLISWLGFNQASVEFDRPARAAGETKYPWKRRLDLAFDGLISFSGRPLRWAMRLGLLISAGSIAGLCWVLLTKYIFQTAITGWASLIFVAFFFGGVQLFFLGLVGSYLARVYDEVKDRPRYVIRTIHHSEGASSGSKAVPRGFDTQTREGS
ncbi:MAG: glycosyltransferase family 2 protein [Bacteroidetes bacterium]|nr:glycosyltransferase family 2 protein [Bacteroidota bacterium]